MTSAEEETLIPFTLTTMTINVKMECDDPTLNLNQNVEESKSEALEGFQIESIKADGNPEEFPRQDSSEGWGDDANVPVIKSELDITNGLAYFDNFSVIQTNLLKTEPEDGRNEDPLNVFDTGEIVNKKNVEESFQNSTINGQVPEISTSAPRRNIKKRVNPEKYYLCRLCHMSFSVQKEYEAHFSIHVCEKPYKCETCEKCYERKTSLSRHIFRKHTAEKSQKCDMCDMKFYLFSELRRHSFMMHLEKKLHNCDMCFNFHGGAANLKNHKIREHPERTECNKCRLCGNTEDKQVAKKPKFTYGGKRVPPVTTSINEIMNVNDDQNVKRSGSDVLAKFHIKEIKTELSSGNVQENFGKDSDVRNGALYVLSNLKSVVDSDGCLQNVDLPSIIVSINNEREDENGNEDPLKGRNSTIKNVDSTINGQIPEMSGVDRSSDSTDRILKSKKSLGFVCRFCKDTFPLRMDYEHHFIIHTGENPYECEVCRMGFSSYSSLVEHVWNHTKKTNCGKSFSFKPGLKQSRLISHPRVKKFKCKTCRKCYTTHWCLIRHERTHTGARPFKSTCGQRFTPKQYLKKHGLHHTSNKSIKCDLCGKAFHSSDELKAHPIIHVESRQKSYPCEMCGKKFRLKKQLKLHSVVHLPDKSYKCDVCGKCYQTQLFLTAHKSIHIGERPYECDLCVNSYSWMDELANHKLLCHHGEGKEEDLLLGEKEMSITKPIHTREKPKFTYGAKRRTPTVDTITGT